MGLILGFYELSVVVWLLVNTHKYAGIIVLGTVIRGEISHFNFIFGACSSFFFKISTQYTLLMGLGILKIKNVDQGLLF